MSIKKSNIELPKQDYLLIELTITNENEESIKLEENDLIYMTVRKDAGSGEIKFQKSLEDGITFNEETKKYEIEINSEDTKDLITKTSYGYDITVYYDGNKPKQKVIGILEIGEKYTLNEVANG